MHKTTAMKYKYIVLFLTLSLSISNIEAQEHWLSDRYSFGDPSLLLIETCGDTVVNGKTYEKLYGSLSLSGFAQLQGGRRIQGDSVFLLNFSSGTETLLYDCLLYTSPSPRDRG